MARSRVTTRLRAGACLPAVPATIKVTTAPCCGAPARGARGREQARDGGCCGWVQQRAQQRRAHPSRTAPWMGSVPLRSRPRGRATPVPCERGTTRPRGLPSAARRTRPPANELLGPPGQPCATPDGAAAATKSSTAPQRARMRAMGGAQRSSSGRTIAARGPLSALLVKDGETAGPELPYDTPVSEQGGALLPALLLARQLLPAGAFAEAAAEACAYGVSMPAQTRLLQRCIHLRRS